MKSNLIGNRRKAAQLLAFDGMQYGRCSPSDIDLSMDWAGDYFIFAELKSLGVALTEGQRRHLTGLVDGLRAGGKGAVAIFAQHCTPDCNEDVSCRDAAVRSWYDGKWHKAEPGIKLHAFINELYEEVYKA